VCNVSCQIWSGSIREHCYKRLKSPPKCKNLVKLMWLGSLRMLPVLQWLGDAYTTTISRPLFRDHLGEPVPEENLWTLWCKRRLTEADTLTIRQGAAPSRLSIVHLHKPPIFLQARCPSCHPTNSVKALKAMLTVYICKKTCQFKTLC